MLQGASLWGGLISGGLSQLQDTTALNKGQMNKKEVAVQTTENVTGAIGIMAGIEYGAMWGSTLMPGVGTVMGAVAGAFIGDRLGRTVGHQAGNAVFNRGNWMLRNKRIITSDTFLNKNSKTACILSRKSSLIIRLFLNDMSMNMQNQNEDQNQDQNQNQNQNQMNPA